MMATKFLSAKRAVPRHGGIFAHILAAQLHGDLPNEKLSPIKSPGRGEH